MEPKGSSPEPAGLVGPRQFRSPLGLDPSGPGLRAPATPGPDPRGARPKVSPGASRPRLAPSKRPERTGLPRPRGETCAPAWHDKPSGAGGGDSRKTRGEKSPCSKGGGRPDARGQAPHERTNVERVSGWRGPCPPGAASLLSRPPFPPVETRTTGPRPGVSEEANYMRVRTCQYFINLPLINQIISIMPPTPSTATV